MLNKVSVQLARKLVEHLKDSKEEIYVYGFEIIISTMFGFASILLCSLFLHSFSLGVIFLLFFVPLRLFVGGYHAETYGKCFVISNLTYLLVWFINHILWNKFSFQIWFVVFFIVSFYIIRNSPVIHPAQPINEAKQLRSKKITRGIISIDLGIIIYFALKHKELISMGVLSMGLVAAFMLLANRVTNKKMEVLE